MAQQEVGFAVELNQGMDPHLQMGDGNHRALLEFCRETQISFPGLTGTSEPP